MRKAERGGKSGGRVEGRGGRSPRRNEEFWSGTPSRVFRWATQERRVNPAFATACFLPPPMIVVSSCALKLGRHSYPALPVLPARGRNGFATVGVTLRVTKSRHAERDAYGFLPQAAPARVRVGDKGVGHVQVPRTPDHRPSVGGLPGLGGRRRLPGLYG